MATGSDRTRMASQEAAYWYIRCTDERAMRRPDRRLFLLWLKQSPENIAELLRICDLDGGLGRRRLLEKIKEVGDSNVVEGHFGGGPAQYDYQPCKSVSGKVPRKAVARRWKFAAVFGGLGLSALLAFAVVDRSSGVLETVASEWQHRKLEDGSTIHMDARTRLKVDLTPGQRIIHLYAGQAAFDVAKDSRRPFIVRTPTVDVIAVGTRFSVSLDNGVTTIVQEGVVKVLKHGEEDESAVLLAHDEQLYVAPVGPNEKPLVLEQNKVHVDGRAKLEWTTGWVNFEGTTVAEMVEQFNRRHIIQVQITDPTVASKHLRYARVRIDSVELFVDAMNGQEGIAVSEDRDHKTLRLLPE